MKITFISPSNFCYQIARFLKERGHELYYGYSIKVPNQLIVMSGTQVDRANEVLNDKPTVYLIVYHWDLPYWRNLEDEHYHKYRELLKRANEIWSASEFTKSELKRIWGLDSEVMYIPLDEREYDQIPKEEPNGLYIQAGRLGWQKKFEVFARACLELNLPYKICHPEGQYGGDDMTHYDPNNLCPKASDERKKFLSLIKNCKCLVACSIHEGLGLPPIEATYMKTPIIVADIPVNREVHGDYALYFEKNNIEDLKRVLLEVQNEKTNNIDGAYKRTKERNKQFYEALIRKKY